MRMIRNKKPVLIVAAMLVALTVIPLGLLIVSRSGGAPGGGTSSFESGGGARPSEIADFDLRQLANRASELIDDEMAAALRQNDISLDFMSELKRIAERAAEALQRGRPEDAKEAYTRVIQVAEDRLAAIASRDQARAMGGAVFSELERLERLKAGFEISYNEAVELYDSGLNGLNSGNTKKALEDFEASQSILSELEARSAEQIRALLEGGNEALENYELETAKEVFNSVLDLDPDNAEAEDGMAMAKALDGISDAIEAIRELENAGQLSEALKALERLAEINPNNPFVKNQIERLKARIAETQFEKLVAQSIEEEAAESYALAIASLEAALEIRQSNEQTARLAELKERYKATRLEILLTDGYAALSSGRYEAARNFYKEAIALAPESNEAQKGLERASSLYLANIRYQKNMAAAAKLIEEGRFPLAANLFNEAMASRPSKVVAAQSAEELRIREILEAQSEEVTVTIRSDRRTFVSMIGVFPPDRLREKELKLFPDVYKVRGTRPGYESVEIEFNVDATQPAPTITVECTNKL